MLYFLGRKNPESIPTQIKNHEQKTIFAQILHGALEDLYRYTRNNKCVEQIKILNLQEAHCIYCAPAKCQIGSRG